MDAEADYDSYSDWESYEAEDRPAPPTLTGAPLKFVLVEEEEPVKADGPRDSVGSPRGDTRQGDGDARDIWVNKHFAHGDSRAGPDGVSVGNSAPLEPSRLAVDPDSQHRHKAALLSAYDRDERIPRNAQRGSRHESTLVNARKRSRPSSNIPIAPSSMHTSSRQRLRMSKGQVSTGPAGRAVNPIKPADITGRANGRALGSYRDEVQTAKNAGLRKPVAEQALSSDRKASRNVQTIHPGPWASETEPRHRRLEKRASSRLRGEHVSTSLPTRGVRASNEGLQHDESLRNIPVQGVPIPMPPVMRTSAQEINQPSVPIQEMRFHQGTSVRVSNPAAGIPATLREEIATGNYPPRAMMGHDPNIMIPHGFHRPLYNPHVPNPGHPGALYSTSMTKPNAVCDFTSPPLFHGEMRNPALGPFPFEHVFGYSGIPDGSPNFVSPSPQLIGSSFLRSDMMQTANPHSSAGNRMQMPLGPFPNEMVGALRSTLPVSEPPNVDTVAPQSDLRYAPAQVPEAEHTVATTRKPQHREDLMEGVCNVESRSNDCPQRTGAFTDRSKSTLLKGSAARRGVRKAIEVDEIPCEEDNDVEDYVSRLNEIPQKQKFIALARPQWQPVRVRSGGGSGWMCTMKATVLKKSPKEVIECVTVARNKNRAKRAAAKEMLLKLKSKLPEAFLSENQGKQTNQPVRMQTAINALHQLAQEGNLPCQPGYDVEEVNEAGENHWRCTTTLFTKDHESKVFVEYGPSKNTAKQKGARKALEAIIKLKSPGAEQYQKLLLPVDIQPTRTMANIPRASDVIFRTSDDEMSLASCDDLVEGTDFRLELPVDYELVIAKTDSDCERWFDMHAQPGTHLGIYIDSETARDSVYKTKELGREKESEEIKFPMLCFSTASAGIVVRVDKREGGADKRESGADTDEPLSIERNAFWVPEIVAETLEDPRVEKAALSCDEGLEKLFEKHGIQGVAVQDIALTSIAIAGLGRVDGRRQFSSLRQLTKYWMRQEVKEINWETLWPKRSELPDALQGADGEEMAAAVLSAFAVRCVRVKLSDAARMKRMSMGGASIDLEVLCKRILDVGTS